LDPSNQGLDGPYFLWCSFCIPRLGPQNFLRQVKGSKAIFLSDIRLVLDIQPLLALALDGVGEFEIKITGLRLHIDANTTYIVDGVPQMVSAKVEYAFPKAQIWMNAEETFTKGDKDRNMKDRIRSQLVQLNPIDKQQSTKKFVD
jgi:hypothetical protein